MPAREHQGAPFDATYTHLAELDAPGDDADGVVQTTFGDTTDLQQRIIECRMAHPDATVREIAAACDCNYSYAGEVLRRRTEGQYSRYRHEYWHEYTPAQQEIIKLARSDLDLSRATIADRVGVSGPLVTKVLKANRHLATGGDA